MKALLKDQAVTVAYHSNFVRVPAGRFVALSAHFIDDSFKQVNLFLPLKKWRGARKDGRMPAAPRVA
jgi:hypothetical protein